MKQILTNDEVRDALYLDADAETSVLTRYARSASSYLLQTTGYDFASDQNIEPLAKDAASMYARQQYFGADGYNREHDYALGLIGLISQLQDIARGKKEAAGVTTAIEALPDPEDITKADGAKVQEAREGFKKLTYVAKTYVTNLEKLENCESALADLEG